MAVMKLKTQNTQKIASQKDNLNLKIIKVVWKQVNLRTK